jgi:hypothetical protein
MGVNELIMTCYSDDCLETLFGAAEKDKIEHSERTMQRTAVALLPVIGKYVIHENESTIVKD